MKAVLFLIFLLPLAACTTAPVRPASERASVDTQIVQAVATPLNDLNLVRPEVPAVLAAASKAPYARPADTSCPALAAEIMALDAALGGDLDNPDGKDTDLVESGVHALEDAAVGAVRGVTDVIPFRRWVRKLTGAERYAREAAAAIFAGTVRRAYLKGLGNAAGCPAPASPIPPKPVPDKPKEKDSDAAQAQ